MEETQCLDWLKSVCGSRLLVFYSSRDGGVKRKDNSRWIAVAHAEFTRDDFLSLWRILVEKLICITSFPLNGIECSQSVWKILEYIFVLNEQSKSAHPCCYARVVETCHKVWVLLWTTIPVFQQNNASHFSGRRWRCSNVIYYGFTQQTVVLSSAKLVLECHTFLSTSARCCFQVNWKSQSHYVFARETLCSFELYSHSAFPTWLSSDSSKRSAHFSLTDALQAFPGP